jgi:hypothetical protein
MSEQERYWALGKVEVNSGVVRYTAPAGSVANFFSD